jgi:hypothetical protein
MILAPWGFEHHDNLQFFELGRSEQQNDQLQNALKRDVQSRKDDGASE